MILHLFFTGGGKILTPSEDPKTKMKPQMQSLKSKWLRMLNTISNRSFVAHNRMRRTAWQASDCLLKYYHNWMNPGTFVWRILSSPSNRGTLLPSVVMWNHQIAGRKSLPHTLADYCRICVGLLCPAFIFPTGAVRFRNKNPAPTFWKIFWKVFRFTRRFVTKGSREEHLGSLSKVYSGAVSKLCNHLKINYFQKMFPKWPFSLPT